MKKILSMALAIIMAASLMVVAASAATGDFKEYDSAQNGELLYEVDFRGTTGIYNPIDGRGDWNAVNAQVSADGTSVSVKYTDVKADGSGPAGKPRARFCSTIMEKFSVKGAAYTVQFTIDANTHVGVHLDGNTGFVINPSDNSTYVGKTHKLKDIAGKELYDGTGASKQTYAIEIACNNEITTNKEGSPVYSPNVYRLYVLDETNNTWRLVRELDETGFSYFEFEYYDNADPKKIEDYAFFYLSINCYSEADQVDEIGNPTGATVSDVKIYKGIDFITKGEPAVIAPPVDDGTTDDGSTDTTPSDTNPPQNIPNPEDFAPPTVVTDAPAATDEQTEPAAEGGCASSIALAGISAVTVAAVGVALVSRKKKED